MFFYNQFYKTNIKVKKNLNRMYTIIKGLKQSCMTQDFHCCTCHFQQ